MDRTWKTFGFFALATGVCLLLSVLFPLWVLLIGPIVYGFPHLFSTLRYVHHTLAGERSIELVNPRRQLYRFGTALLTSISLWKLAADLGWWEFARDYANSLGPELTALGLSFAVCAWIYRKTPKKIISSGILLGACSAILWRSSVAVIGGLLLAHNFVAFFCWINFARRSSERHVAWAGLGTFTVFTALILCGAFDPVYARFQLVPWSSGYRLWFHACVAYAFGQSMYYFIWLKAIPDYAHAHEVPTSFRQGYRLLKKDFAPLILRGLLMCVVAGAVLWTLVQLPEARIWYFAIAAFYGCFELGALTLLSGDEA